MRPQGPSRFRGELRLTPQGVATGFAVDGDDPTALVAVEILADGLPIALVLAVEPGGAGEPGSAGEPGGHGFSLPIDPEVLARARRIVARVANHDVTIGAVAVGGEDPWRAARPAEAGRVVWRAGLELSGHVLEEPGPGRDVTVRALVDGTEVASAVCRSWRQLPGGAAVPAFALHLPAVFADGRVRPIEVLTGAGTPLAGSPCLVVAFPDPLADWIDGWAEVESERLRARYADGLLPRSLPLDAIEGWLARFSPPRPAPAVAPRVAVVLVGREGVDASVASLEAQVGVDWSAAALAAPGGSRLRFDGRHLAAFLAAEAQDCGVVVLAVAGTLFAADALATLAAAAAAFPEAAAVYPDLLVAAEDGSRWPSALPAFDPELFLETGYCGFVFGLRREAAVAALAAGAVGSLFDLFPAETDVAAERRPVHVPVPLATVPALPSAEVGADLLLATRARLARWGTGGTVEPGAAGLPATVRVARVPAARRVAVLLAVRDTGAALERTLAGLAATAGTVVPEIVIADGGSTDPATLAALDAAARGGARVLRRPGWFCVPDLLARAAADSGAGHLLFLEPGLVPVRTGWLEELLGRCAAEATGAVGPLVAWRSGVVRDAGLVVGSPAAVVARFTDRMIGDPGPGGRLSAAHRVGALSSACLLTPRRDFEAVGGFDADSFPLRLFGADYCLKLRAAGRHVLFTPHARLVHDAPVPLPPSLSALDAVEEREARLFRYRWSVAPGCDPFYTPWMAMDAIPYSGLAWPPAPLDPRRVDRPTARPIPAGC